MDSRPLVSIIIPVYNQQARLGRCLSSLAAQTLDGLQLVAVDDGSTDGSRRLLADFSAAHPGLMKVIAQPNQGVGAARNHGLAQADAEVVGFVDSDDYVEPDMFSRMFKQLQDTGADVAVCDYRVVHEDTGAVSITHLADKSPLGSLAQHPEQIYMQDFGPWNKLFRKALWEGISFPVGVKYEDLQAVLEAYARARQVTYLPAALYDYVSNQQGETQTRDRRVFDILTILSALTDHFADQPSAIRQAVVELCAFKLFQYASIFCRHRQQLDGRDIMNEYLDRCYAFLDGRCPGWRGIYVSHGRGAANTALRIMQTSQAIYTRYYRRRLAR